MQSQWCAELEEITNGGIEFKSLKSHGACFRYVPTSAAPSIISQRFGAKAGDGVLRAS